MISKKDIDNSIKIEINNAVQNILSSKDGKEKLPMSEFDSTYDDKNFYRFLEGLDLTAFKRIKPMKQELHSQVEKLGSKVLKDCLYSVSHAGEVQL